MDKKALLITLHRVFQNIKRNYGEIIVNYKESRWCSVTHSRKTAKNWAVSLKLAKILTVSCKSHHPIGNLPWINNFFLPITSLPHLEQKHTIYSMVNDMWVSIWGHQGRIIRKEKNIWTLTTDRNMVQLDTLLTELRGTCRHLRLNPKLMF